jgi:GntR family transcriptional regulator
MSDLRIGDKLPSEQELANMFEVSRPTIRQAMNVLNSEGKIDKKRGSGTYVSSHKYDTGLTKIISLADQMKSGNINFTSKLIDLKKITANHEIAVNLEVKPRSEIIYIERLRFVNYKPMYLTMGHVVPIHCNAIFKADLNKEPIFESIKKYCGIVTNKVKRNLEVIPASEQLADLLDTETGVPLYLLRTYAYTVQGYLWGYFIDYLRGDKCQFTFFVEKGPFAISRMPAGIKDKVDIELVSS